MRIHYFIFFLIIFVVLSCKENNDKSEFLLLSDKEAPLGWSYFTIYKDSTFEFINRGLVDKYIYPGKAKITEDTIFLKFRDSIPVIGTKVLYKKDYVEFVQFHKTRFKTRLNKLVD